MWRWPFWILKYGLAAFGLILCLQLAARELSEQRVGLGLGVSMTVLWSLGHWLFHRLYARSGSQPPDR